MKSPLEEARDKKKGKSKYEKQYNKRQRKDGQKEADENETARALEDFQHSDEIAKLSTIERSLEENRRQREYLLKQHRR